MLMAAAPQPSGKPSTPPPAYSDYSGYEYQQHLSATQAQTSNPASSAQSPVGVAVPLPFPAHTGYGPTPIPQQTQLLPYYDLRSPYAVAEANRRARWRFIEAALWALVVLSAVSFVMGWEVEQALAGGGLHRRSGVWASQ
ncbi:hypothetical protein BD309DRAFT_961005 [Dichomitus squalens]|uniref:Uncharacterized protein n=1 Tax=Dichomitus squalens TaxID=114155 RepID=A0A4Q9NP44_9APHY|nr:hypothetical protein BD309DRAFT_961005 [Dichomitus squalens]TBU63357.1 hypothetical protein BD310DRAFT_917290 [Dichomitus squalens]